MNYFFELAPGLTLTSELTFQLLNLDRDQLIQADDQEYDMNPNKLEKVSVDLNKKNFEDFYGAEMNKSASCITWYLPDQLEEEILNNYKKFFQLVDDLPEIRLQSIFGMHIPLHIDKHRTVSIIHPLKNHNNTYTEFYTSQVETDQWQDHYRALKGDSWPDCSNIWEIQNLPEYIKNELLENSFTSKLLNGSRNNKNFLHHSTIGDPSLLKKIFEVEIESSPCILNVNKWHSVYCPDKFTEQNPRLSLFFKWRNTTFTHVVDAYWEFFRQQQSL